MEKLMYALWKPAAKQGDEFRDELLAHLVPELNALSCVQGLRLCVADSAVAEAAGRRMESHAPAPDAMVSIWVDDGGASAQWEPLLAAAAEQSTGYLVAEAEPLIAREAHPSKPGERQYGMCHVVFMSPPDTLSRDEWFRVWKDSHTQVAIDTQSTFGYRLNVVVRVLTEGALASHAIVEENF
ncbi:MAG: hypothetical protein HKN19_06750, partial [Halioglobus sp.]|nr:hypothetical protein [Halioglobus sp.]